MKHRKDPTTVGDRAFVVLDIRTWEHAVGKCRNEHSGPKHSTGILDSRARPLGQGPGSDYARAVDDQLRAISEAAREARERLKGEGS